MSKTPAKIDKLYNIVKYPILLKTITKKIDRLLIRNLVDLKNNFNFTPNTIFDIGAAVGDWTQSAAFVFPDARIHGFEPIKTSYEVYLKRFKDNPNITSHNVALSDSNGAADFYLNEFSFSSSLLKMTERHKEIFPVSRNERVITVAQRRLDDLRLSAVARPVLLKLDVQGAELSVLQGAGDLLNKVDVAWVEVNFEKFYEGQVTFLRLAEFFSEHGFDKFIQINPEIIRGMLVYSDFIFIRQ